MSRNILYFTRTMGLGGTENIIIQLCDIMKHKNKVVVCSCGGRNIEKLNSMGIKHYTIPDIENKNLKNIFVTILTILKIIKNEKITVIHTHHRMAAFYTTLLSYIKKFTFINTVHNTFYNKKMLTRFSYKRANIVAVGKKVKENLCTFYKIPENKIVVIYNGIKHFDGNIDEIESILKCKKKGNFIVCNIGRLSEQKGMEYFIKAASIVLKTHKKVKFFLVGEGEERSKLEALIKNNNLKEHVILLGYRNDVQNVMSQVDLVVLSSLWEGLPLTPIEAFSVGKTIVATDVDGTSEIVIDKINGRLVKPKSPIELATQIKFYIENPNIMKEDSEKAKEYYKKEFTIDRFNQRYIELYERCQ